MRRELIREKTMQIIFQMDCNGNFDYEELTPIEENIAILNEKQAVESLKAIKAHITEIDDIILENLDKWKPERVAKTDMAILRNAVAEMLYIDSIPNAVSINEAVELAKKYGEDKSYAFVNSVLKKINESIA